MRPSCRRWAVGVASWSLTASCSGAGGWVRKAWVWSWASGQGKQLVLVSQLQWRREQRGL